MLLCKIAARSQQTASMCDGYAYKLIDFRDVYIHLIQAESVLYMFIYRVQHSMEIYLLSLSYFV